MAGNDHPVSSTNENSSNISANSSRNDLDQTPESDSSNDGESSGDENSDDVTIPFHNLVTTVSGSAILSPSGSQISTQSSHNDWSTSARTSATRGKRKIKRLTDKEKGERRKQTNRKAAHQSRKRERDKEAKLIRETLDEESRGTTLKYNIRQYKLLLEKLQHIFNNHVCKGKCVLTEITNSNQVPTCGVTHDVQTANGLGTVTSTSSFNTHNMTLTATAAYGTPTLTSTPNPTPTTTSIEVPFKSYGSFFCSNIGNIDSFSHSLTTTHCRPKSCTVVRGSNAWGNDVDDAALMGRASVLAVSTETSTALAESPAVRESTLMTHSTTVGQFSDRGFTSMRDFPSVGESPGPVMTDTTAAVRNSTVIRVVPSRKNSQLENPSNAGCPSVVKISLDSTFQLPLYPSVVSNGQFGQNSAAVGNSQTERAFPAAKALSNNDYTKFAKSPRPEQYPMVSKESPPMGYLQVEQNPQVVQISQIVHDTQVAGNLHILENPQVVGNPQTVGNPQSVPNAQIVQSPQIVTEPTSIIMRENNELAKTSEPQDSEPHVFIPMDQFRELANKRALELDASAKSVLPLGGASVPIISAPKWPVVNAIAMNQTTSQNVDIFTNPSFISMTDSVNFSAVTQNNNTVYMQCSTDQPQGAIAFPVTSSADTNNCTLIASELTPTDIMEYGLTEYVQNPIIYSGQSGAQLCIVSNQNNTVLNAGTTSQTVQQLNVAQSGQRSGEQEHDKSIAVSALLELNRGIFDSNV